jgi:hypothetical protein
MKIHLVRAESFDADRETEGQKYMTKQIVVFLSYVNAPKNGF